jgi:hypothetical protein
MSSGFNTQVWGPWLWSVLQGASWRLGGNRPACDAFATVVDGLPIVLPCRFCRDSVGPFMEQLARQSGALPLRHALQGHAPEWVSRLHALVETKLTRQRFVQIVPAMADAVVDMAADAAAATGGASSAAAADMLMAAAARANLATHMAKTPSHDVLLKRYVLSEGEPFAVADAWRVLLVITLAFEDAPPSVLPKWVAAFAALVALVPRYEGEAARMAALARWLRRAEGGGARRDSAASGASPAPMSLDGGSPGGGSGASSPGGGGFAPDGGRLAAAPPRPLADASPFEAAVMFRDGARGGAAIDDARVAEVRALFEHARASGCVVG